MEKKFTAGEVRAYLHKVGEGIPTLSDMLRAYADLLEANEKAKPVATVRRAETGSYWIDWHGKQMPDYLGCNLFTHPTPHKGATHCDNCGCTWLDDGNNPIGCPYCKPTLTDAGWKNIVLAGDMKAIVDDDGNVLYVNKASFDQQVHKTEDALATVSALTADAERSAEALDGFINTGNPHWDKAAFQSRKEGNRPGSGAWMRRIRELLAAHSVQAQPPAASVPTLEHKPQSK